MFLFEAFRLFFFSDARTSAMVTRMRAESQRKQGGGGGGQQKAEAGARSPRSAIGDRGDYYYSEEQPNRLKMC